jgi:hypothetical protein
LRRAATYLTGFESFGVAMGDVNSDGKVDLVTAQRGGKPLSVLLGRGTGRFRIAHHYRGTSANGLGLGDFNGDGNLDVALAATRRRVSVRLGRGDGTFGSARSYASGREPWDVTVADLNGDATPGPGGRRLRRRQRVGAPGGRGRHVRRRPSTGWAMDRSNGAS